MRTVRVAGEFGCNIAASLLLLLPLIVPYFRLDPGKNVMQTSRTLWFVFFLEQMKVHLQWRTAVVEWALCGGSPSVTAPPGVPLYFTLLELMYFNSFPQKKIY
jgi:hypothetical protein